MPLAGRDQPPHIRKGIWTTISTHMPLAGRDSSGFRDNADSEHFYSHAPRGARLSKTMLFCEKQNFYSHAPRGARLAADEANDALLDFYSHAPRGARRRRSHKNSSAHQDFYSHAPRGARPNAKLNKERNQTFLLTCPSRGATCHKFKMQKFMYISTHMPLAGRDCRRRKRRQRKN